MRLKQNEKELVNAILLYLKIKFIFAWRNNSGAMAITPKFGARRFVRFGAKGSPDIIGILPNGRFWGIECKVGYGKQTEAQKEFQAKVENAGGLYTLAYSLEDIKNIIDELKNKQE